MNGNAALVKTHLSKDETFAIIVLNVGDGDAILVRFPVVGDKRSCAVVDCCNAKKTIAALESMEINHIPFICATHPHYDHTKGLAKLIRWADNEEIQIDQFWDSGFRHVSKTHYELIRLLRTKSHISFIRPTSGYETVINQVRVLVLNPSIYLKNRYDTYGTNINNASIVIKLEYPAGDFAPYFLERGNLTDEELESLTNLKQNTVILGGDAQFDAWARITQEFPELKKTSNWDQQIDYGKRKHRPLRCQVFKAPHHLSKHGLNLEVVETLHPRYTIGSCSGESNHGFPHELAVLAVTDIRKKKQDNGLRFTGHRDSGLAGGSIVAIMKGRGKRPIVYEIGDDIGDDLPLL